MPMNHIESSDIVDNWLNGKITNFEYLMILNIVSGRTFKNASRYPIFPWIIQDYSSLTLNLNDINTYRDLSKSMKALYLQNSNIILSSHCSSTKYYSSTYSVYNFLVRFGTFSSKFIGDASSIFKSISESYKNAITSRDEMHELIPEFFFLPEFLKNINKIDFVDDVILPPWANKSAIEFIYLHRKALESDHVSNQLSKWIDLIWGYKQDGNEAYNYNNDFSIELYQKIWENPDINQNITADLQSFYGQIPYKLFNEEHQTKKVYLSSFIPKSSIPYFNERINSFSYKNYINSTTEESKSGNSTVCCDVNLIHNFSIVVAEGSIDINKHRLSFNLIDQDGFINIYFADFNFLGYNIPICTSKIIQTGFISKVKNKKCIIDKRIESAMFINSNLICYVFNKYFCLIVNYKSGYIEHIIEQDFEIVSIQTSSEGWLSISTSDSSVTVYYVIGFLQSTKYKHLYCGKITSFKEPINCMAINPKFNALIMGSKDNCLLFSSLDLDNMKIYKMIKINGLPQKIIVTDNFGFVVVSKIKYVKSEIVEKLILYTINGEKIRSCNLENNKRIVAMISVNSFPGSFDFLIVADSENYVFVFEAFYMKFGKPIFKSCSKIIKLSYSKEESNIMVFCENGTVSIIYYPILS